MSFSVAVLLPVLRYGPEPCLDQLPETDVRPRNHPDAPVPALLDVTISFAIREPDAKEWRLQNGCVTSVFVYNIAIFVVSSPTDRADVW